MGSLQSTTKTPLTEGGCTSELGQIREATNALNALVIEFILNKQPPLDEAQSLEQLIKKRRDERTAIILLLQELDEALTGFKLKLTSLPTETIVIDASTGENLTLSDLEMIVATLTVMKKDSENCFKQKVDAEEAEAKHLLLKDSLQRLNSQVLAIRRAEATRCLNNWYTSMAVSSGDGLIFGPRSKIVWSVLFP